MSGKPKRTSNLALNSVIDAHTPSPRDHFRQHDDPHRQYAVHDRAVPSSPYYPTRSESLGNTWRLGL